MSARSNESIILPDKNKHVSSRNDLSKFDTPEITWEFYNAYHSAKPTRAAYLKGTNSIEDDHLDSFFKSTLSRSKFSSLDSFLEEKPTTAQTRFGRLPHPFNLLCPMQDQVNGKWYDLKAVLHILKLPRDTRLEKATIWEQASAFVVAMIRQRVELFDTLREFHDLAIKNFPTSELIQQAKEIILIGDLSKDMQKLLKSRGMASEAGGYNNSDSESDYDSDGNKLTTAQKKAGGKGKKKEKYDATANETWKGGATESLTAHADAEFANDPAMQLPDQTAFETMTATLLGETEVGIFLPRPKLTIMKMMNSGTLINERGLDWNEQTKAAAAATLMMTETKFDATGVAFVDDDYELKSDEEWATDSDEESYVSAVSAASSPNNPSSSRKGLGRASPKERAASPITSRNSSRVSSPKGGGASGPKSGSASHNPPKSPLSRNNSAAAATPTRGVLSRGGSRQSGGGDSPVKLSVKFEESSPAEKASTVAFDALGTGPIYADSSISDPNKTTTRLENGKGKEKEKAKAEPRAKVGAFLLPPDSPPATPVRKSNDMGVVTEGNDVPWVLPDGADDSSVGYNDSLLSQKLRALTPQKDKSKISKVSSDLDQVMLKVVETAHEIEKQVVLIKDALVRGILDYNAKLTYEERNLVFDELTALLGDDYPPREGFFDWRGKGVPGMRPRVIRFFCLIHHMASLRLELLELNTPEGRSAKDIIKPLDTPTTPWQYNDDIPEDCPDTGRWAFVYNGVDVVKKVLHSLDFLRAQKEVCSWYGRSFYFCANPLMLPFHIYKNYVELDMNDKIKEQLTIKPHVRPLISIGKEGFRILSTAPGSPTYESCNGNIASLSAPTAWKHEKYLAKWRILFDMQCVNRYPNWPNTPSVKSVEQCSDIWTAFMVMYIHGKASIIKTYTWERKFISLLSTVRGKDLMIGHSGLKPDLMLDQQSERRLIEAREEAALKKIKDEENARKSAADRDKQENSTMKFLSGLMNATAAASGKGKVVKTDAEIAAELAEFERKLVFKRLTKLRTYVDLSDPKYDYPYPELFQGYSSVLDTRPATASDLGFGRSQSRSPSRPVSAMSLLNPLKLRPISLRLYSPPPSPEPEPVIIVKKKKKKVKEVKQKGSDDDDDDDDDDDSVKKKNRSRKKKKGTKTNVDKLLNDVVKPGEGVTRRAIKEAVATSSKVSRLQAPSDNAKKMTRRVEEEILPPVRRGGGGFAPEMRTPIVPRRKNK